jgi:hypothetical protein
MEEEYFKEVQVDWSSIPLLQIVESHIGTTLGLYEVEKEPALRLKEISKFSLKSTDYILHKKMTTEQLIQMYDSNGFQTRRILEDPWGHKGPTVACPIGFPFNLPKPSPRLKRFNRWICRVHVDIAKLEGDLVSIPHIEPDPSFHKLAHLWDTFIKRNVVRGREAVAALNFLGIE